LTVHEISRADARRIAVQAQWLDRKRQASLLDVVRHLTLVQVEGTKPVAPSADLVLWSRLGSRYRPAELQQALQNRVLVELEAKIRPAEDIALYGSDFQQWRDEQRGWPGSHDWVRANDAFRRDLLFRLTAAGPMAAAEMPDSAQVPWQSSGWNNNRNVIRMLECMEHRGEVAVAMREGNERVWDLAGRIYPDDPAVPAAESARIRDQRRLRSLGIVRAGTRDYLAEPWNVGEAGEPAVIEGVRGKWRVEPALLGQRFTGRAALLSPFDRLIFDRKRMQDLFDFDYQLEIYKPVDKRRWGYYALPVLFGDQLVGKVDAAADRDAGVLRLRAIHQDVKFTAEMIEAVNAELDDLAHWLELDLVDA
jgi:uncharacterized protein